MSQVQVSSRVRANVRKFYWRWSLLLRHPPKWSARSQWTRTDRKRNFLKHQPTTTITTVRRWWWWCAMAAENEWEWATKLTPHLFSQRNEMRLVWHINRGRVANSVWRTQNTVLKQVHSQTRSPSVCRSERWMTFDGFRCRCAVLCWSGICGTRTRTSAHAVVGFNVLCISLSAVSAYCTMAYDSDGGGGRRRRRCISSDDSHCVRGVFFRIASWATLLVFHVFIRLFVNDVKWTIGRRWYSLSFVSTWKRHSRWRAVNRRNEQKCMILGCSVE